MASKEPSNEYMLPQSSDDEEIDVATQKAANVATQGSTQASQTTVGPYQNMFFMVNQISYAQATAAPDIPPNPPLGSAEWKAMLTTDEGNKKKRKAQPNKKKAAKTAKANYQPTKRRGVQFSDEEKLRVLDSIIKCFAKTKCG